MATQTDPRLLAKFGAVFVLTFMILAFTLEDGIISRMLPGAGYGVALIVSLVLSSLVWRWPIPALIGYVIMAGLGNLSPETAQSWSVSRDLLSATFVSILLTPLLIRFLDM